MINYNTYDDETLLNFLKEDNQAAFSAIYERYWNDLFNKAYRVIDDKAACEDVVQDIFVWLWDNRKISSIQSLKPYLNTSVKYRVLNLIRQGKIRNSVLENYQTTSCVVCTNLDLQEIKELQQMVAEFMAALPQKAGKIFYLSREEKWSHKEIAEHLKISEKTVKNQIHITLKKFKMLLEKSKNSVIHFFL